MVPPRARAFVLINNLFNEPRPLELLSRVSSEEGRERDRDAPIREGGGGAGAGREIH